MVISLVTRDAHFPDNVRMFVEKLASSLPEFVYIIDLDESHVSYRSRDFIKQLGYDAADCPGGLPCLSEWIHPEERGALDFHRQAIRQARDDEVVETTCRIQSASLEWRWYQIRSIVYRRDDAGRPIELVRTLQDVSVHMRTEIELREKVRQLRLAQIELRERQDQLQHLNHRLAALATTDGLTGIYNYRAFQEKLSEETRRSRRYGHPLCLILADLDNFKAYNDQYGHPAGDERLRYFARLLRQEARGSDFVARYGGEEFAILLTNTTGQDGASYAQRIVDLLNKEIGPKRLTASFGCAQLAPEDQSKEDLVLRCDECLYAAKHQGKNRVILAEPGPKQIGTVY